MGFMGRVFVVVLAVFALGGSSALAAGSGTVSVRVDGRGAVTSDPAGISCIKSGDADPAAGCTASFCVLRCLSALVRLTPNAAPGFSFRGWSRKGDPCEVIDRSGTC
jgi:hypothetical protein